MIDESDTAFANAAERLVALYDQPFGGKARGRFRISMKHLRGLTHRRRLYAEDIDAIGRALYELGYVLIDLEGFFVILSQRTFASYRRVNETSIVGPAARAKASTPRNRARGPSAEGGHSSV